MIMRRRRVMLSSKKAKRCRGCFRVKSMVGGVTGGSLIKIWFWFSNCLLMLVNPYLFKLGIYLVDNATRGFA